MLPPQGCVSFPVWAPSGRRGVLCGEGWGRRAAGSCWILHFPTEQKLSGSHKALVEMQDVVAELLRTVPREHPATKVRAVGKGGLDRWRPEHLDFSFFSQGLWPSPSLHPPLPWANLRSCSLWYACTHTHTPQIKCFCSLYQRVIQAWPSDNTQEAEARS